MASLPDTNSDSKTLSDAWDFKGRAAVRSQTGRWASAAMILGSSPFHLDSWTHIMFSQSFKFERFFCVALQKYKT
jgi:hypothetical protein